MQTRCAGFSMMEVLVAMLVIGTGALALVMLQLHALRSSAESARHASATLLALELAELRAASLPTSPTSPTPGTSDPYLFSFTAGKTPQARADCDLNPCSPGAFANAAIADWAARLARDFPEARATVCRDAHSTPQDHWSCDEAATAPVVLKLGWRRGAVTATAASARAPLLTLVLGR
ncbi:type IV pilus modification protein PilV [Herbaspirillum sp. AP02]|uniref:type IV pilus modification protein PilV n=1 Tax=unclassified Herbaspirillum TaxID=2624150 RepID=UPI0015DAABC9|nr:MULTISPECIES: type IV pilus modification protein PilV [unclassified Herbaspirillum]MBG7621013.1 type IV pilus modification protein PilV [Herbaspirillum sp. AP02]NZD68742.1 type IV pilus modification protein PilV [Herbaspirillum sp. AP21]